MDRLELSILGFLVLRIVMWIHSSFVVSESQNLLELRIFNILGFIHT